MLGDPAAGKAACDEALQLLGPIGDQWALNHLEGMLGGLAQAEHRYEDAVAHLRRAAEATRRLGFAAAQAHHLANLGRAQEQSGDRQAAASTLARAIDAGRRPVTGARQRSRTSASPGCCAQPATGQPRGQR